MAVRSLTQSYINTASLSLSRSLGSLVRLASTEQDIGIVYDNVEKLIRETGDDISDLNVTREMMQRHFAEKRFSALIIKNEDDRVVATAVFSETYSTWDGPYINLEDIFVRSAFRGRGVGTVIFQLLARICKDFGYSRLAWESLKTNEKANKYYNSDRINAVSVTNDLGHLSWRLDKSGIERLASKFCARAESSGGERGGN